jgi:hypothetical protein
MELITVLIYIFVAIICLFITVSPLGCWNCLKEIKKRQKEIKKWQKEDAELRHRQMLAVQKSLKEISASLSFIASSISQQDDETA